MSVFLLKRLITLVATLVGASMVVFLVLVQRAVHPVQELGTAAGQPLLGLIAPP